MQYSINGPFFCWRGEKSLLIPSSLGTQEPGLCGVSWCHVDWLLAPYARMIRIMLFQVIPESKPCLIRPCYRGLIISALRSQRGRLITQLCNHVAIPTAVINPYPIQSNHRSPSSNSLRSRRRFLSPTSLRSGTTLADWYTFFFQVFLFNWCYNIINILIF